jgi:hypothetical protein
MSDHREWFRADKDGNDILAERAFARLIADLPLIEPDVAFVDRTVQAAWRMRDRPQIWKPMVAVVALLIGAVAVVSLYALSGSATELFAGYVRELSRSLIWLLTFAAEGVRWWWIADRIGAATGRVLSSPISIGAFAAAEIVILLAICAFRLVVQSESETRS